MEENKKKENYLIARPEKIKKLLSAVSNGYKYTTCCKYAGISETAFYDWKKKGKDDFENEKESEYATFYTDLTYANSIAEIKLMDQVRTAGDKDWRASSWILEHRFGYSKTINVKQEEPLPDTEDEIDAKILELEEKLLKSGKPNKD